MFLHFIATIMPPPPPLGEENDDIDPIALVVLHIPLTRQTSVYDIPSITLCVMSFQLYVILVLIYGRS